MMYSGGNVLRAVTGFIIATLLSLAPCAGQARAQRVVGELLPVLVNGKWGFIDRAGKVVVEPQFDAYSYLEEGLMAVEVRGKWGYANAAGEIVIGPQFADARDFSE